MAPVRLLGQPGAADGCPAACCFTCWIDLTLRCLGRGYTIRITVGGLRVRHLHGYSMDHKSSLPSRQLFLLAWASDLPVWKRTTAHAQLVVLFSATQWSIVDHCPWRNNPWSFLQTFNGQCSSEIWLCRFFRGVLEISEKSFFSWITQILLKTIVYKKCNLHELKKSRNNHNKTIETNKTNKT